MTIKMAPQQSLDSGSIESIGWDDSSETNDEFLELPVAFQSIDNLMEEIAYTKETSRTITLTNKEIQERDLRHAEELRRHAEELETLYNRLEESNVKHAAEIRSMECRFRDESQKREAILEKALSYAEKLEARQNTKHYTTEIKRLKMELQKRDSTIEELRIENLEKDNTIQILQQKPKSKQMWPQTCLGQILLGILLLAGLFQQNVIEIHRARNVEKF